MFSSWLAVALTSGRQTGAARMAHGSTAAYVRSKTAQAHSQDSATGGGIASGLPGRRQWPPFGRQRMATSRRQNKLDAPRACKMKGVRRAEICERQAKACQATAARVRHGTLTALAARAAQAAVRGKADAHGGGAPRGQYVAIGWLK